MPEVSYKTEWIKEKAKSLGFLSIGFAKAQFMEEESVRLKEWLGLQNHGSMSYLDDHFEKRVDPTKLVSTAKTVISFAYNYYTEKKQADPKAPKISKYAYGRDYHKVIKKKLKLLSKSIEEKFGEFNGRSFVDSAPILERDWAKRAGLGWIGKNTLLINPEQGSFFLLSEMIVDFECDYGVPMDDFCGTCTKCIDACPTDAISENGFQLNASKCISYITIEFKEEKIPTEFEGLMENWMYGCDICQDVCPWNKFSKEHNEPDFVDKKGLLDLTKEDWNNLTEEQFDTVFFGSPVKRTQYKGLKRNIDFLNSKN